MIRRPAPAGRSRRVELALHLVLLAAAVCWLPFGTRDAGGVSNVLPALHPLPPVPAPATEAASTVATELGRPLVIRLAVARPRPALAVAPLGVLSAVVAVTVAVALPTRRRRSSPGLALGWHPHAPSRAPPVAV